MHYTIYCTLWCTYTMNEKIQFTYTMQCTLQYVCMYYTVCNIIFALYTYINIVMFIYNVFCNISYWVFVTFFLWSEKAWRIFFIDSSYKIYFYVKRQYWIIHIGWTIIFVVIIKTDFVPVMITQILALNRHVILYHAQFLSVKKK